MNHKKELLRGPWAYIDAFSFGLVVCGMLKLIIEGSSARPVLKTSSHRPQKPFIEQHRSLGPTFTAQQDFQTRDHSQENSRQSLPICVCSVKL